MCGIVGIIEPGSGQRGELLRRMCAAIEHRGPDARGTFEDERAALGMQRLSIIDVAHGEQPVYNESRTIVAVFNGEIYNFKSLAQDLRSRGHRLASASDSEVIPHLYEEYGDDFTEHLRGMFAISIWDLERKRLLLVRDRLGKKPLYYKNDQFGFSFASEMKALLTDPRTSRDVDEVAISHYLTYQYVPAPFSALSSIKKLEPGCLIAFEDGQVNSKRYWTLKYADSNAVERRTEAELAEELRERLLEAVRIRLVAERPLGAFLSGGLDSSAIVAAMSHLSHGSVKTFSIGFEDENYNELPFAKRVAELYSTDHHELIVHPDIGKILPQIARSFDEPYADSSAIPSYYLAEMARANVVVALNGDGGDEALGGTRVMNATCERPRAVCHHLSARP
jgi:asparagine synthase (glutamine-hydrolysing)